MDDFGSRRCAQAQRAAATSPAANADTGRDGGGADGLGAGGGGAGDGPPHLSYPGCGNGGNARKILATRTQRAGEEAGWCTNSGGEAAVEAEAADASTALHHRAQHPHYKAPHCHRKVKNTSPQGKTPTLKGTALHRKV